MSRFTIALYLHGFMKNNKIAATFIASVALLLSAGAAFAGEAATTPRTSIDIGSLLAQGAADSDGISFHRAGSALSITGHKAKNTMILPALDATRLRGKIVTLRFHARNPEPSQVHALGAWLRTDVYGGSLRKAGIGLHPIPPDGIDVSARLLVDSAASKVRIGVELDGKGRLLLDNLALDIGEQMPLRVDATSRAPLSGQVLKQLEGWGKALALVTYFSPGAVPGYGWSAIARQGVQELSRPMTPAAYASTLKRLLEPYAPGATLTMAGQRQAERPLAPPAGAAYLTRKVYRGFGTRHYFFRSWTEYAPLDGLQTRWPVSINEDLGGHVHLHLPVLGYADQSRQALGVAGNTSELQEQDIAEEYSGDDRYTRLANVLQLWGALRHFYPYSEVVAIDWNAMLKQGLSAAAQSPTPGALTLVLDHMLTALQDAHAWVSGPEFPASFVPALHLELFNNRAYVTQPGQRTDQLCHPSELPFGSELLTIDGEDLRTRMASARFYRRVATDTMQRRIDADWLLAGPATQPAVVRYRTPAGELARATLSRSLKTFDVVCDVPHPAVEMLQPGVWYVDLNQANEQDLQSHEQAFIDAKAVIFDARKYVRASFSYLGHFSHTAMLGPKTDIPLIRQPNGEGWLWDRTQMHIAPLAPAIATRVFYLIDGDTISRAETYLQIVRQYGLGTIVGERSAGTSGDVSSIALPGGYQAYWTGLRFLTQDGMRYHGIGIVPDIEISPSLAQRLKGGDTVLEATLQLLNSPGTQP